MGKTRPRDLPPSRRSGGRVDDRRDRPDRPSADPSKLPAGSEISVKMQQIADQIDHLPIELANAVSGEDHHRTESRSTGAELVDVGLLHHGARPASAHVVTIDAYPNPDRPESLVVRLDGWDGFLLLTLTRDRAMLLANRLNAAVEKSQAWYGPKE